MKVVSDTNEQENDREPFQIIIRVEDDAQTEQSASSSSNAHFTVEERASIPPKQIHETISLILRLFRNLKFTTSDTFLAREIKEIDVQDASFYFCTLRSIDHTRQLVPHAENMARFIGNLNTQINNAAEIFQLMGVSKELTEDSRRKKELIVELIKSYEDNLKFLKDIFESIKVHKGDISKAKDLLPVKEVEVKRIQKEFRKWDREARVHFSYVKGFFVCFCILVFFEMIGFLGSHYYLSSHHTVMMIVYCVLLCAGIIFYLHAKSHRSKANDHQWEVSRLRQEIERNKQEIENVNGEDTKTVELYLAKIICQLPLVLEYWRKRIEDLEGLSIVDNFGQEDMSEKWIEFRESCENYAQVVSDILDQNGEEDRRVHF